MTTDVPWMVVPTPFQVQTSICGGVIGFKMLTVDNFKSGLPQSVTISPLLSISCRLCPGYRGRADGLLLRDGRQGRGQGGGQARGRGRGREAQRVPGGQEDALRGGGAADRGGVRAAAPRAGHRAQGDYSLYLK